METDLKLLTARINDLIRLCEKRGEAIFSDFLDGGSAAFAEDELRSAYGYNTMLFGGYAGAERRIFGIFPEWREAEEEEFPITALRIDAPRFRSLTHRDYLGTLMSLGIDRCKTGDILTDEDGAWVFLREDIAEYAERNVNKIANIGVKTHLESMSGFTPPRIKTVERACVCASARLDAVTASALNLSRGAAEKLISGGCVKVNHRETLDRSKQLSQGDLLSVRGKGRFILKEIGANTGKGRLHIIIEKFV